MIRDPDAPISNHGEAISDVVARIRSLGGAVT